MNNKQAIYPDALAQAYLDSVGSKYRPSNGTEGEIFRESFCNRCQRDVNSDCPIYVQTLVHDVDEPEYPKEWQYGADGQPTCTAFLAASAVSITGESVRHDFPIRQPHLDKAAQRRKLRNRRRNKLVAISRRRNRKP